MVVSKQKWLISLGLLVFILCTLGLPYTKMNFFWDSYGDVLHAVQAGEQGDFFEDIFLHDIRLEENHMADNEQVVDGTRPLSLFSFIYRPLIYWYWWVQYKAVGKKPYLFFLVMIMLHALVAVLLFLLLAHFITILPATLLACFFAYNHAWWSLLRWIAVQFYFLEALSLMLFVWCLYKTLTTNQFWWGIFAGFCLFHNLFLKEQSLALLPWIGMVFLAEHVLVKQQKLMDCCWIKRSILFGMPSIIAVVSWVLIRVKILQNLRIQVITTQKSAAVGIWQYGKILCQWIKDLPSIVVDLVGLNWFPPFHKVEKALLLLIFLLFFVWLFRVVNSRGWFLFFLSSYLLFAWPTYTLRHYHPRYIYFAMIFFIGLVALALKIMEQRDKKQYRFALMGLTFITLLNAAFLVKRMHTREYETDLVAHSFKALVAQNPGIFQRTMCFYGLPPELFDACVAQAMAWLAPGRKCRTIYYFKYEKTKDACKLDESFLATDPLFITWDMEKQKMVIVPISV